MKILKTYAVWIDDCPSRAIIACSPSKARYEYHRQLSECLPPYRECFGAIRSKSLGAVKPEYFFGDSESFVNTILKRNIEFARMGMKVKVGNKEGIIVGSNSSSNLDVIFEGESHKSNCHPHWDITYLDKDDNVIIKWQ